MADIYDAFNYMRSNEYENELNKPTYNFVPLDSKKYKPNNVRYSPIAFVKPERPVIPVKYKKSNASPSTMTAMYGIRGTSPIIKYDRDLDRPFSPIVVNTESGIRRASNKVFKPIEQSSSLMESSTTQNRSSPTTYIDYQRSLANARQDDDLGDWGFYDKRFKGGKKRTRKLGSRYARRKRTKRSYSRRYRNRKGH